MENSSGTLSKSETGSFETKSIPLPYFTYQYNPYAQAYDESFKGYILTHQRDNSVKLIVILNNKGKIVWYQKFSRSPNVYNWTSDGTILCMLSDDESLLTESDEILELNLFGDTIAHIKKSPGTFSKGIHHDIMLNRAGNIYVINYDYRLVDFSSLGYPVTDTLICDGITELDREGNKLWEWSVFDVADPLEDPESYVRRRDWLHANSILEYEDRNLLLSFRHPNQIWKIDRTTGSVIWKFGEKGDFTLDDHALFSGQHHISFSHTGDLMLFDNNNETSQSRVLYFDLNESFMTAYLSHEIDLPRHYYTYIMGSAFETADHNLLVSSTSAGAVALVDYAGSIIFEITTGTFAYKAILLENLNDNYLYCE
jgi:DNA-binding beta-propeller fold protein YncE